jgi:hypothetical protein
LSSYSTSYKKDTFSSAISNTFCLTNPDGIKEIPRSIHTFDKLLKNQSPYLLSDIKNFEISKYKINIYDIFNSDNNEESYNKIKKLYIKYFFNPSNLIELSKFNSINKINRITYICLSDKSFYNFCLCMSEVKKKYPELNLSSIRIVYFGIQDIFQRSNIKKTILDEYKEKFMNTFQFI